MIHILLAVIYLAFISLGLPDSLLGSSWPMMHVQMDVDVSYAGIVSVLICCGTVASSLLSDRLTRKFGTGLITAVSVFMTAAALLGFSVSTKFWMLCLLSIPYGLGAGAVDAALNNYVAVHYASRHMSWLHCMWGLGASIGPYIMSACLSAGKGWPAGYQSIGLIQVVLAAVLFLALPIWKKPAVQNTDVSVSSLSLPQIFKISGAKAIILSFFCYCGAESTLFLWTSSYLVMHRHFTEESAAALVGVFYLGMTLGRALNGFLTIKWNDKTLIQMGSIILLLGIVILWLPFGNITAFLGLLLIGLGCAPVYPCIIHSTPEIFGTERSQALIGVQMAGAYLGALLMPPIFGYLAEWVHISLFPFYLLVLSSFMIISYQILHRKHT